MDVLEKAKILGDAGKFDSCGPKQCEVKVNNSLKGLYHSESENKNCVMFKTLMTNKCSLDCAYCPNSSRSKPSRKVSLSPDELTRVFNTTRDNLKVNGLFLSSGIPDNPNVVMENMLDTVNKVRKTFRGYIHLKIMPGASLDFIKEACKVANRVSVNIEAPSASSLSNLSDCKDFKVDILRRQAWIKRFGKSQSTQMIVSEDSTDKDILKMTNWEYNSMNLSRVYYSALNPVQGTMLERAKKEPLSRQNNLYKVDFLLREYKFKYGEFASILEDDMLPHEDPKVILARNYFSGRVDLNESTYEDLIRVPGIGLISAKRIVDSRNKFSSFSELKRIGVNINRASPFIELAGKKQLTLNNFT